MEVTGVCAHCGAHGIVKTCTLCGQLVCRQHFDAPTGACVVCARRPGGRSDPKEEPANLPEVPDDAGGRYT